MVKKSDPSERIIRAAFELAPARGWRRLRLAEIAEAAGVPLVELYRLHPSKASIFAAFVRRLDEQVLAAPDPELAGEPARDRLFAVVMRRFDALGPYKEGLRAILSEVPASPTAALCGALGLARSMAWMLEAAGLGSAGARGRLRVKGLTAIYLCTLRVWLSDESEDQARTMAALDRHLGRVDRLLGALSRPRPGDGDAPEAAPAG